MNKKWILLIVILLIIAIIVGIVLIKKGTKKNNDKIVMVTEAGFAPYEYYEGTEIVGVDVDVAKEIAAELGKELVIKDVVFDSILNEIKFGTGDFAAAALTITDERAEEVDFSIIYTTVQQVIIVPVDSDIKEFDDIHGKTMSIQTGSAPDLEISETCDDVKMIRTSTVLASIEDIKAGKADFTIMDEEPAKHIVEQNPELKIINDPKFEPTPFGIAVKKGNTELLNKINKVLERLISEGKIEEFTINHTK